MSRLDQRVKSVELRRVSFLTSDQIAAALATGEEEVPDVPESVVSANAPFQWKRVEDAWLYPRALTGLAEDRVEIYSQSDLDLAVGNRLHVSGIHWTSNTEVDATGDNFTVKEVDTPPWTGRSYRHDPTQDQLAGVTITNTYSYKPDTKAPSTWSSRRRFQTRRLVDTFSITGNSVTLTMNADHHFKANDVVFVDIFNENSTAYGLDGLFRINSVTNNTIVYTLAAGVATPTGTITPGDDVYVFPVARKYAPVGSTWADSTTDKIYFWDGLRWVDAATTSLPGDGDPPSPPTGFNLTETPKVAGADYQAYSEIVATWTAPTTSQSGDPLSDLLGYRFNWRESTSAPWGPDIEFDDPTLTTFTFGPSYKFLQGKTYYFRLFAYDSGRELSNAVTDTISTTLKTGDHTNYQPTDPVATSRLGTITVTWDGKLKTGPSTTIAADEDIIVMKIYLSTVSGFTPGPANLALTTRVFGPDGGFDVLTDLNYNTSYYIRISLVDTSGVEGQYSEQVTAQVQPLVNTDIIYSTLNTWPFVDGTVSANALANGSVTASKILGGAVQAEALANGAVTALAIAANAVTAAAIAADAVTAPAIAASAITAGKIAANAVTAASIAAGSITSEKITAGAIGAQQIAADAITADKISAGAIGADEIAAGAIIAGKIGADAVTAATIAAGAIEAGKIATNAITADKIQAGAITAVKIESDAITSDKIQANAIVSTKIAAGAITADKIQANSITATQISTAYVYAGEISADKITSGELVGRTIRTVPAGNTAKRIIINTQGEIVFFNLGSSTEAGRLEATASGLSVNGASGGILAVGGAPIVDWNSTAIGLNQNVQVIGRMRASGQVQSNNGACIMGANITTTGTISADSTLDIGGTSTLTGTATFGGGIRRLQLSDGTTTTATFNSTGFLIRTSSSQRYKTDISNLNISYNSILALQPKVFRRIEEVEQFGENAKYYGGFIAEELAGTELDVFVFYSKDENNQLVPEGIHYEQLSAALVLAIKEQSNLISNLEARIAALEGQ